jgi:hypothetical protein
MSYSELKVFDKNGDAIALNEFRNSQYIRVIWDVLAKKYGVLDSIMKRIAVERRVDINTCSIATYENLEVYARGELWDDMQPVWDLQNNPNLSEIDYRCLMFTFDYAVIPPEDIEAFAYAFDHFEGVEEGTINHGHAFAQCMRDALDEIDGIRGIALYSTSVCDDPWYIRGDDYRPYNLDIDDKHWFIPNQEEHLKSHFEDDIKQRLESSVLER